MQPTNVLISDYPAVSLPSYDAISQPAMRAAVEQLIGTYDTIREAHDVNSKLKAGHQLDKYSPQQIAEMVEISREGAGRLNAAREAYMAALGQHRGTWQVENDKRLAKTRTAVRKLAAELAGHLNDMEVYSGVSEMLAVGSPELKWRPPAGTFEMGSAQQAMQGLLAFLDAVEQ